MHTEKQNKINKERQKEPKTKAKKQKKHSLSMWNYRNSFIQLFLGLHSFDTFRIILYQGRGIVEFFFSPTTVRVLRSVQKIFNKFKNNQ